MKTCRTCHEVKPLDELYAHPRAADGRLNDCKGCKKAYENNSRAAHGDHVRVLDRLAYHRNPEQHLRRHREYVAGHLNAMREHGCQWIRRNPEKKRAAVIVNNAVRDGRLHKEPCRECGDPEVEGHHPDYSKPYEVVWLCDKHHKRIHRLGRITMKEIIEELVGHLGAASIELIPEDDAVIADHVRKSYELAKTLRDMLEKGEE